MGQDTDKVIHHMLTYIFRVLTYEDDFGLSSCSMGPRAVQTSLIAYFTW
jgi:hypothetical protein